MVTIALPKGRLADDTVKILDKAGYDVECLKESTRKLILYSQKDDIKYILVKPSDVPEYIFHGAADAGVVGQDTLLESGRALYELMDLGFGKCNLAVAGCQGLEDAWSKSGNLRVATKYPKIARDYFYNRGENIEIIKLNGSVELGPITGLSDVIVDIVESGRTLKENGLDVLEIICPVSARFVVNQVSLKTKKEEINDLLIRIKDALEAGGSPCSE